MKNVVFHLLGNAHLDPTWLWDWREGLNEGLITVRTILDLMEENPKLTFMRGEASIYQHIEKQDPATFERVRKMIAAGRWDVVGGTYVQPDTNLPSTEALARQFTVGQAYFRKAFGVVPRVAWAADSFGHSAGLPEIMAEAGMTGFAFTRPEENYIHLPHPAFWWESASGRKVLSYRPPIGWYGTERDEVRKRFDGLLAENEKFQARNIGFFYGLGNHGGGPTRHQLAEIEAWAAEHPEVEVVHSGLHRFFDALAEEEKTRPGGYPVFRGELNFCLRGCYVSVAKFKFPYRRTEANLLSAEKTDAVVGAALQRAPADLHEAWESLLYHAFHDILPGTSIERAYEDHLAWLGLAYHRSQRVQLDALNALAAEVNTAVPVPEENRPSRVAFLVWNPHPYPYDGPLELEASLDYRPLWAYQHKIDEVPVEVAGPGGELLPFQIVANEHSAMPDLPWRKRVVLDAQIPSLGWSVYQVGLAQEMKPAQVKNPVRVEDGRIGNRFYSLSVREGASALQIFRGGEPLFDAPGLSFFRQTDAEGSWGGKPDAEPIAKQDIQEKWRITDYELLETGPLRESIWVRFSGERSRIDLTFQLGHERDAVDVLARVFWNERASRLRLVMPVGGEAEFDIPGGRVRRGAVGDVPGGRWVRSTQRSFGFASDALYGFRCQEGALYASIVRATRYAYGAEEKSTDQRWRPAVDAGELTFRFLFTAQVDQLEKFARELEQPPVSLPVPPHAGSRPATGGLFQLSPSHVQLLALKPTLDGQGLIVRVQEAGGTSALISAVFLGKEIALGDVTPWAITTFHLKMENGQWASRPANIQEIDS